MESGYSIPDQTTLIWISAPVALILDKLLSSWAHVYSVAKQNKYYPPYIVAVKCKWYREFSRVSGIYTICIIHYCVRSKYPPVSFISTFGIAKCIRTHAPGFPSESFAVVAFQWFSLPAAYKLPGICHLTAEMFRGLVHWMAGWLTLPSFCPV